MVLKIHFICRQRLSKSPAYIICVEEIVSEQGCNNCSRARTRVANIYALTKH